jgi:hypothetical protein
MELGIGPRHELAIVPDVTGTVVERTGKH